ncbi:MAG TPA: PqqD family protein, partial [Bryobacteraceae bacterium]|nr:PqqD family protein [Bryobacteraceae bacterium]
TPAELAEALATRYAATSSEILAALDPFLEQLQKQELIAPVETRQPRSRLRIPGDERGLPFVAPSLEAFQDLEGLLLLDPIHEVDEEGWPPPSGAVTA